jgi:signal transduction histidine kinase
MFWLRDYLAAHQLLLALLHGQAFFVLGLSIAFLARRIVRLELARGLASLAAFGFCEALLTWSPAWVLSDVFTNTSLEFLRASNPWFAWSRLIVLGVGYACLLAFAIQSCAPSAKRKWEHWAIAGGLLGLWLIVLIAVRLTGSPAEQVWLGGEIAARYGLALPGGLVGAWGLRRQTYRTISPERLSLVKPYLRIAWLAVGLFAVFGGLIGPAAPFFPANWLNEEALLLVTGFPISFFRGLCGLAITYGVVRALGGVLNEVELWLENMERVQSLSRERERIGRELHDGTIQSIYAAGLLLEGARYSLTADPGSARDQLTHAITSLNQTIKDIRRYIFDLRGEMMDDDLETGLRKILQDFRVNTLLETEFTVEGEMTRMLRAERRQHIFQIARETLTNVARHAQARRVEVRLRYDTDELQLCISDDGIGLPALPISGKGQGLRNIRERARLLDGVLDMYTAPNEGMTLSLTVPY